MSTAKKVIWLLPEKSGGIHVYAKRLYQALSQALSEAPKSSASPAIDLRDLIVFSALDEQENAAMFDRVREVQPDIIHIQHEYAYFGKKYPFLSRFQNWLEELRKLAPQAKIVVTAHTVISEYFRYGNPLLDLVLLPIFRPFWQRTTWKNLDGVIVHSRHQLQWIQPDHPENNFVVPLFVPDAAPAPAIPREPIVLIFGYFSAEKGQLVAIEAMKHVKSNIKLVMAGSVRREKDRAYFDSCVAKIRELGVQDRCEIVSKYLSFEELREWYARATLVLTPFTSTTGSASLVEAYSQGCPVLASDLLLNQEINERVPGSLALFKTEDAIDCARQIDALISDPQRLETLRAGANQYREKFSLANVAREHLRYYGSLKS